MSGATTLIATVKRLTTSRPALVAIAALLLSGPLLHAQVCSDSRTTPGSVQCTIDVTLQTNVILKLTVNTVNAALGTPVEADYVAGFKDVSGAVASATVKSNRAFQLQVLASTTNFGFTNTAGHSFANPNKPASDMLWATTQAGLSTTTKNMGTQSSLIAQGGTSGVSQSIFVRTNWSFIRDVPGNYSLTVNFTVSAP
jgi:hypothetical protein